MLAFQDTDGTVKRWQGEPVRGVLHPINVETLWSTAELTAVGLYRITAFTVPAGKVSVGPPRYALANGAAVETYDVADEPAPPVPETITDRQFFQQLAIQGVITQDEALAAVGPGTLPATLAGLLAQLPADQQFGAKMKLIGQVEFHRHAPITGALAQMFGWDSATTDTFWRTAALLG